MLLVPLLLLQEQLCSLLIIELTHAHCTDLGGKTKRYKEESKNHLYSRHKHCIHFCLFIFVTFLLRRCQHRVAPTAPPHAACYSPCSCCSGQVTEDSHCDLWDLESYQAGINCICWSVLAELQLKPRWFEGLSCSFNWISYPLVLLLTRGGEVQAEGSQECLLLSEGSPAEWAL